MLKNKLLNISQLSRSIFKVCSNDGLHAEMNQITDTLIYFFAIIIFYT